MKAIVTAQDLPPLSDKIANLGEGAVNTKFLSNNVLAAEKVLYKGYAVAAVAATSPRIAEEALGLIEVDYEVLPPVLDVREAMHDKAPILHEGSTTTALGTKTDQVSNIASHYQLSRKAGHLVKFVMNRIEEFREYRPHAGFAYRRENRRHPRRPYDRRRSHARL